MRRSRLTQIRSVVGLTIAFGMLALLFANPVVAATTTYNHDPYFATETQSCTVDWKCTTSNADSSSYVIPSYQKWWGRAYCTGSGPCRADTFQGHKPWGWGTAPNDMPRVNFVGGSPAWDKWVDFSIYNWGYVGYGLVNYEVDGLRLWVDFGGLSACHAGKCSTDGVVEIALLYNYEGIGWAACLMNPLTPQWIWQTSGGKSWWEFCAWPVSSRPPDSQWVSYTTYITPFLNQVASGVGRQASDGWIFMIGAQTESYYAMGNIFQVTTLRFWGQRGL